VITHPRSLNTAVTIFVGMNPNLLDILSLFKLSAQYMTDFQYFSNNIYPKNIYLMLYINFGIQKKEYVAGSAG
jgi:hypothetical protein